MERDVLELALRFYEGLHCPRSLSAAILLRYQEYDQLVSLSADPVHYANAAAYAKAAAASDFLRKCQGLPTSYDLKANALSKWKEGEAQCFRTNERLGPYDRVSPRHEFQDPRIAEFIGVVRKIIRSWIGRAPSVLTDGRFGPGATYSDRGRFTTIPDKIGANPSWTGGALWYLPQFASTAWAHAMCADGKDPVKVKGNRFTTVPKDAKTNRAIAAEPSINIFFQLGLAAQLRRHLKNVGIDLDYGQIVHGQVAREASIRGHLATLDLSNASDTLASSLVSLLLPQAWAEALSDLRSPSSQVEGTWVRLEKFSSMGNGFTFELETLVFAALCAATCQVNSIPITIGKDLLVYGDDMIVPTTSYRAVKSVLEFFGFSLNAKKSFSEGPFRESCGADFWNGMPVRSHFLKEFPNEPQDWIAVANGIRRVRENLEPFGDSDGLRRAWFFALDRLPSAIRSCRGPKALGDLVIHDELHYWTIKVRRSIRYVRVYRPARHRKVSYNLFKPDVVLACATYGCGWNNGGVTPRDSVLGYKVGWASFS